MAKTDIVGAGYFISRVIESPPALSHGLLPDRILTVSSCLTDLFPDFWALDWTTCSDVERSAAAQKFSISAEQLPTVIRYMTDAFNANQYGWPSVWQRVEHARKAAQRFLPDPSQVALVGIGMPVEAVQKVLDDTAPRPMEGATGYHMALSSKAPLESGGEPLGWDVLGFELGGGCHSWLCNSIHIKVSACLGINPATMGLLASELQAREVVDFINANPSKAEPVPWYPVLVVRYPLRRLF